VTDEQLDALTARLDFHAEALNNIQGYLEYLAKRSGYGNQNEVEAHEASHIEQYWNRLDEAYRTDGTPGGVLRQGPADVVLEELTEEQQAHLAAKLAQARTQERLRAKRSRKRRTRRHR